jgi:DNA-binding IclR family transcriptional regulator
MGRNMEAIDRTFGILELFLNHEDALSITELAKLSSLSPAVTHRIVTALLKKGYLVQKEKRGKYSLGLKFLDFSYAIQENIKIANVALPFLMELNKEADEAVSLGILDGNKLLVVERIDTSHDLRVGGAVGKRAPLHSTAAGKLLITQMSESERESIFNDPSLGKFTKNTITKLSRMEKELALFRAEGCAFDREETAVGIWSVAAPVYGITGKIEAGVSLLVPTARITDEKALKLASLTKSCAAKISRELGYKGNQEIH